MPLPLPALKAPHMAAQGRAMGGLPDRGSFTERRPGEPPIFKTGHPSRVYTCTRLPIRGCSRARPVGGDRGQRCGIPKITSAVPIMVWSCRVYNTHEGLNRIIPANPSSTAPSTKKYPSNPEPSPFQPMQPQISATPARYFERIPHVVSTFGFFWGEAPMSFQHSGLHPMNPRNSGDPRR